MSTVSTKPLPKSLHTVTVIVRVARLLQRERNETRDSAVVSAFEALGYSVDADPYDLRGQALRQMGAR